MEADVLRDLVSTGAGRGLAFECKVYPVASEVRVGLGEGAKRVEGGSKGRTGQRLVVVLSDITAD